MSAIDKLEYKWKYEDSPLKKSRGAKLNVGSHDNKGVIYTTLTHHEVDTGLTQRITLPPHLCITERDVLQHDSDEAEARAAVWQALADLTVDTAVDGKQKVLFEVSPLLSPDTGTLVWGARITDNVSGVGVQHLSPDSVEDAVMGALITWRNGLQARALLSGGLIDFVKIFGEDDTE